MKHIEAYNLFLENKKFISKEEEFYFRSLDLVKKGRHIQKETNFVSLIDTNLEVNDRKEFFVFYEKLKKECAPILEILKKRYLDVGNNYSKFESLFRGFKIKNKIHTYELINNKKNRTSKDTPLKYHKLLDDYFYNKFDIRGRSECVFATSYEYDTKQYGNVYAFYPVGDFNYIWSPKVRDLYMELRNAGIFKTEKRLYDDEEFTIIYHLRNIGVESENLSTNNKKELIELYISEKPKYFQNLLDSYIINEGIIEAIEEGHEIMFDVDKYYLTNTNYAKIIKFILLNDI